MGAIVKTIEIHGDNLEPLLDYGEDEKKTSLISNDLENLLSYAQNPEKTLLNLPDEGEQSKLVSGVLCTPETAQMEFASIRETYREQVGSESLPPFDYFDKRKGEQVVVQKQPVTAIHAIQSFYEEDMDPRVAHQIGIEFCERLGVQAVVDTHMDKKHIHNHIIINAYMPDGQSKISMNKEKRMSMRQLSDDIQREYGIDIQFADPEQQLRKSRRSLNYKEWSAQREGASWKERMRSDITAAKNIAQNPDEYQEIIAGYGYTIEAEKNGSLLLWNKDHTKKIWDRTLGEQYIMRNIFNMEQTPEIQQQKRGDRKSSAIISVAKYDWNGRRRSALEIIVRKAIALIQRVSRVYHDLRKDTEYHSSDKLHTMETAIHILRDYDVADMKDLSAKLNTAGKNLSQAKSAVNRMDAQKSYYDSLSLILNRYENAYHAYKSVQLWNSPHDLHINEFTKAQIFESNASLSPTAKSQRSELYNVLSKHPGYRISEVKKGYTNISSKDAQDIINFLSGRTETKPDVLLYDTEADRQNFYDKQYENLKRRLDYPIPKTQQSEIKRLLSANGHGDVDISKLTVADAINIRNCYAENPYLSPLIDESMQSNLKQMLNGRTLNRPVQFVTKAEYKEIEDYLNNKNGTRQPSLLKEQKKSVNMDADLTRTRKLADDMSIEPSVPWDAMTHDDIRTLYGYLVSHGRTPHFLEKENPAAWERNKKAFHDEIAIETPAKQQILIALRNATNELAQLGLNAEDIPALRDEMEQFHKQYKTTVSLRDTFSNDYKELLQLRQQVSYATSSDFLFGPLFDEEDRKQEEMKVRESDERDEQRTDDKEYKGNAQLRHFILKNDFDIYTYNSDIEL